MRFRHTSLQDDLKNDVGLLKYRWFVRVVHFATSELVHSHGDFRFRSIAKGRTAVRLHIVFSLVIYFLSACLSVRLSVCLF